MAILKTIECDVCKWSLPEHTPNAGFQGWGAIQGVQLNGVDNPTLCPVCLGKVMPVIDLERK